MKKIVYVDGFAIRNTLDPNFEIVTQRITDISIPYSKSFIPEGEIWIDHVLKEEAEFLLKIEDYYNDPKNLKEIRSYRTASGLADEQRAYIKKLCVKGKIPNFVEKIQEIEGIKVVYVDGSVVRRYIDPEFTFGGHELTYSYIPKGEVWIDVHMDPRETKYVVLHEVVERKLMKEQRKPYDTAHDYAIAAEKESRTKDGFGSYPDYSNYKWRGMTNEEIINKFYKVK